MARVLIECPVTGHRVWTGIEMDQRSFDGATIPEESFRCPACGQTHSWGKQDASLEDLGSG